MKEFICTHRITNTEELIIQCLEKDTSHFIFFVEFVLVGASAVGNFSRGAKEVMADVTTRRLKRKI